MRSAAAAVRWTGGGFAVGVQWHPEYDFGTDAVSRGIFTAFGNAMRMQGEVLAAD